MASDLQQIIHICAETQRILSLHTRTTSKPISISHQVDVQFPRRDDSLARIEAIRAASQWGEQIAVITSRYWEACHRLQKSVKCDYDAFCQMIQSLEHLGGPTDIQLQETAAKGFSKWYIEAEHKLADVILRRLASTRDASNVVLPIIGSEPTSAKAILRRTFTVNPMPTDAERDYLAKQTGMTYRQVTVWFQNNRSRRISSLPKRGRQQSLQHPSPRQPVGMISPPQTASTMASLHEVEQHLRNVTDSPLAQHITMDDAPSPHNPLPPTTPPIQQLIQPKSESNDDAESTDSTAIVSRSHLMVTEPRDFDETRAFDGHADALSGLNDDSVAEPSQTRKIIPLRKSRLSGKKAAAAISTNASLQQNATTLQLCENGPPSQRNPFHPSGIVAAQLNPTDILHRAELSRFASTSSVSTIDGSLENDPPSAHSRVLSPSSSHGVLTLPLSSCNSRSVSGSSAAEVDASLDLNNGFRSAVDGMAGMIPMFNFLPPTPSNMGFAPAAGQNAHCGGMMSDSVNAGTNDNGICETPLQFDPIDFSTLFGFPSSSSMDAGTAAQNLLKDLDDLDFGAFLHSPETSDASGSPDQQRGMEAKVAGSPIEEQVDHARTQGPPLDQLEYLSEQMDAQTKQGDGMDIDPAIFEMLRGILSSGDSTNLSGSATPNLPPPPHPTLMMGFPSRAASEYDPSLSALAIDLSALLDSSPGESSFMQTTPSDVSESMMFPGSPDDELVTPVFDRSEVPLSFTATSESSKEGEVDVDAKQPDWQGLLDFSDMFDAFWTMVDETGESSAGRS